MLRTGIVTTYLVLRLLVGRGFIDTYLTFREESTKDNFRIADKWDISDIAPIQTAVGWRYTFNTVLA
jgi:hypothetical protein